MSTQHTLGTLLLLSLLAGGIGTGPAALARPSTPAQAQVQAQNAVVGEWSGKLDWINVRMALKLQGSSVTGTFFLGSQPFAIEGGTWDAKTGRLSLRWINIDRPVAVQGVVQNGAFQGTAAIKGHSDPLVMQRTSGPSGPSGTVTPAAQKPSPYVMQGVVKDAQGKPLAGVEVFADNTLYYNMNARSTTDAQGRYAIELPRQELGTWVPGAYVQRKYHGVNHKFRLYADNESAFTASGGAVRNFVWRLSGKRGDEYLGKRVYVYTSEGVRLSDVEVTLTPQGPLVDGSTGQPLTRRMSGGRIDDVPLGRYTLTARLLRDGSAALPLLVSPGQGGNFGPAATNDFETSNYGVIMEFTVKRGPTQAEPTGQAQDRSISGTLSADEDLKGTVLIACIERGGECDEATVRELTIPTSGRAARYRFEGLQAGQPYSLYAWKDLSGDGEVGSGDLVGIYGAAYGLDGAGQTVTAPRSGADFTASRMQ